MVSTEYGSIEREIYVEASPEILFAVVSDPTHVAQWWPDEAHFEAVVGSEGEILFGDPAAGGKAVAIVIEEVRPPTTFAFRWTQEAGQTAAAGNSMLVRFELEPRGDGTVLRFSETGFREMGWEAAVLEREYADHAAGWDHFLPRIRPYAEKLAARS